MSEIPQLTGEDAKFLQSLSEEMDRHLELPVPTHEELHERYRFLRRYFVKERGEMIAEYLDDRENTVTHAELSEQDEHARALFENTVDMMFKLEEPMYVGNDGTPVHKDGVFVILFLLADRSQTDLNLTEKGTLGRMDHRDVCQTFTEIMQLPSELRQGRVIDLFDEHIWSTVQRFLKFGEEQS